MRRVPILLLVPVALVACERDPRPAASPQATEAQQAATRDACIARDLLSGARESTEALEQLGAVDAQLPGAGRAAFAFARAYEQYAELLHGALAHADSAVNHARTPADSARHEQTAESFLPRRAQPGTLEGNIAGAWTRDFATLLADEDHRCHWDP